MMLVALGLLPNWAARLRAKSWTARSLLWPAFHTVADWTQTA